MLKKKKTEEKKGENNKEESMLRDYEVIVNIYPHSRIFNINIITIMIEE